MYLNGRQQALLDLLADVLHMRAATRRADVVDKAHLLLILSIADRHSDFPPVVDAFENPGCALFVFAQMHGNVFLEAFDLDLLSIPENLQAFLAVLSAIKVSST